MEQELSDENRTSHLGSHAARATMPVLLLISLLSLRRVMKTL